MMADQKQAKRFFGIKFGYGEPLQDGVYAIPTDTPKGKAFMKIEIKGGQNYGKDNFSLFWDEELKVSWYNKPKPEVFTESKFSKAFRAIEKLI